VGFVWGKGWCLLVFVGLLQMKGREEWHWEGVRRREGEERWVQSRFQAFSSPFFTQYFSYCSITLLALSVHSHYPSYFRSLEPTQYLFYPSGSRLPTFYISALLVKEARWAWSAHSWHLFSASCQLLGYELTKYSNFYPRPFSH